MTFRADFDPAEASILYVSRKAPIAFQTPNPPSLPERAPQSALAYFLVIQTIILMLVSLVYKFLDEGSVISPILL